MRPTVAVIGGGISGLSAAHTLAKYASHLDVILLEASSRLGGVLETTHRDGFLIEGAAENFLTNPPPAVDLCHDIGQSNCLSSPNSENRRSLVMYRGRLQPIPPGFVAMAPSRIWPLLKSRVLSWRGKLRVGCEYFIPRRASDDDESVASFVCRRFGSELYQRLVQPLVGSIYGVPPERLSLESTMPRFRQMERECGSLIRAAHRQRRKKPKENSAGARYSQFAAPRHGMSSLIEAIAQRLPDGTVELASPVNSLLRLERDRWLLLIGGDRPRWQEVDALILATPAYATAKLLARMDSVLADELAQIEYSSCALISLGYCENQIERPLDGFGFVVPLVERRNILSCSYSSVKYNGRAPKGTVLLRVFIGGAIHEGLLRLSDNELIELARSEVSDVLKIHGEPILTHVSLRPHSMPQYEVGHRERINGINQRIARFPTLALAGSAYGGVGIPSCVASGQAAAEACLSRLKLPRTASCATLAEAEASL